MSFECWDRAVYHRVGVLGDEKACTMGVRVLSVRDVRPGHDRCTRRMTTETVGRETARECDVIYSMSE